MDYLVFYMKALAIELYLSWTRKYVTLHGLTHFTRKNFNCPRNWIPKCLSAQFQLCMYQVGLLACSVTIVLGTVM